MPEDVAAPEAEAGKLLDPRKSGLIKAAGTKSSQERTRRRLNKMYRMEKLYQKKDFNLKYVGTLTAQ